MELSQDEFTALFRDKDYALSLLIPAIAPPDGRGCCLWTGALDGKGYPQVSAGIAKERKTVRVSRLLWEIRNGPIPQGLLLRHLCGRKLCTEDSHFAIGTMLHNAMDEARLREAGVKKEDGRSYAVKLTEGQVREIRRRYVPYQVPIRQLAEEYGVSPKCITAVVKRKSWPLVKDATETEAGIEERCNEAQREWNLRRARKHRKPKGDGRGKLGSAEVIAIRRDYTAGGVTQKELASRFGVSAGYISQIVNRLKWAWLDDLSPEVIYEEASLPKTA